MTTLVISDTHFPYAHPDTLEFLKALKQKLKPHRVVHIGDEVDHHAISFHDHSPDLMSPSNELEAASRALKQLAYTFPRVTVLESNHGSLVYRRASRNGIPRSVIKPYRDMLGLPQTWEWKSELIIDDIYFHHSRSGCALKSAQSLGLNTVFGHHHNKMEVRYFKTPTKLLWGMFVGCLIDFKSLAFAYAKNQNFEPVLGCAAVVDGKPCLFPMKLNKQNRWTKKL